ncbi:hypothetical protein ABW19_dt0203447 [Dactylella cylindrospora]|nr:hypothetical protein ABW19_dt0203447 [Dactylella cylindrospora]
MEYELLSVDELRTLWELELPGSLIPKNINIEALQLVHRLEESVSIVKLHGSGDRLFVFKGVSDPPKYRYHELKMLLSIPNHKNIVSKPSALITGTYKRDKVKELCLGFLLPYFPRGTLRTLLPQKRIRGNLRIEDQFKWAKQITSALIHINCTTGSFYSDLKLDNLLLSSPEDGEDIVLIDFEGVGTWMCWAAPEIRYLAYLTRLARSELIPDDARRYYGKLLREHLPESSGGTGERGRYRYTNPAHGYNDIWIGLKPDEREMAETHTLGKALWCVFEGVGSLGNNIAKSDMYEEDLEFPEFRRTPEPLKDLIRRMTRERRDPKSTIFRRGAKFYPRGRSGRDGEEIGTAIEAQAAAVQYWRQELDDMEDYLRARNHRVACTGEPHIRTNNLPPHFLKFIRPKLREVLAELERIEPICVVKGLSG